jgi:hypothetical protein
MSSRVTTTSSLFLSALVAIATVLTPGGAGAADTLIQPGAEVNSSIGQCTLNYVFRNGGTLYIGTAGHCSKGVGDVMTDENGARIGTVAFRIESGDDDFTLIAIDPARYGEVSPAVRNWGGPTGSTVSTLTNTGDVLLLSGYGLAFSTLAQSRGRPGILADDTPTLYLAELPAIFGDSGGPVIEASTGKALGIVSGIALTIPPSTLLGPTVEGTLHTLATHGFSLQLVTAPFSSVLPL